MSVFSFCKRRSAGGVKMRGKRALRSGYVSSPISSCRCFSSGRIYRVRSTAYFCSMTVKMELLAIIDVLHCRGVSGGEAYGPQYY